MGTRGEFIKKLLIFGALVLSVPVFANPENPYMVNTLTSNPEIEIKDVLEIKASKSGLDKTSLVKSRAESRKILTEKKNNSEKMTDIHVLKNADHDRILHAKELLGKHYKKSVVRMTETPNLSIDKFIAAHVKKELPKAFQKKAPQVAQAILTESKKYKFDPMFLAALIENESSFNPLAKGEFGEIGLMQIRPETAKWISKLAKVKGYKNEKSLKDPVLNIRIGSAYIDHLRNQFDSHGRLYLSAYNMGPGNVHKALGHEIWPKDYSLAVMSRYIRLYTELKVNALKFKEKLSALKKLGRSVAKAAPQG